MKFLIPLITFTAISAYALPQDLSGLPGIVASISLPQQRAGASATRSAAVSGFSSASSGPSRNRPYYQVPPGLTYNDPEGGKRIHPYDREDLCVQVVNKTLIEGAVVNVARCLNNSAPLPGQRNLFNLTTLNITSNYTGLIAPVNQTTLCLSGKWHVPQNATDHTTDEKRQISLQKCNNSDPHQIWRYGLDSRVTNSSGRAYKLTLDDQNQCATILRDTVVPVPNLVIVMAKCLPDVESQLIVVHNGTSTPTGPIPNIPYIV